VGAVPGRRGWVLISAAISFAAPHSSRELADFSQVKHLPPVLSMFLNTTTIWLKLQLQLQFKGFPEITQETIQKLSSVVTLLLLNSNSLLGSRKGTLLGAGTIQYTPIHVTRDLKIITSTAFSKLYFFLDHRMKCLLFSCGNNFMRAHRPMDSNYLGFIRSKLS